MNSNFALSLSGVFGSIYCLSAYGAYHYAQAEKKPAEESDQKRNQSLSLLAKRVASVSAALGAICFMIAQRQCPEPGIPNENHCPPPPAFEAMKEPLYSISYWKDELTNVMGKESIMTKVFQVIDEAVGLSRSNFLKWKSDFVNASHIFNIDNIRPDELKESVMWGIANSINPFVTFRFEMLSDACNCSQIGVMSLVHVHRGILNMTLTGGIPNALRRITPFDGVILDQPEFTDRLHDFALGKSVSSAVPGEDFAFRLVEQIH